MSEISFTPITWREDSEPAIDAINLNRIEDCLTKLVEKANAYDKQPHIRYVEIKYNDLTIPSIGYLTTNNLPEGLPELAEGEFIVSACIRNWGTISPAAAISVATHYILGAPGTTISRLDVYFTIAEGGW